MAARWTNLFAWSDEWRAFGREGASTDGGPPTFRARFARYIGPVSRVGETIDEAFVEASRVAAGARTEERVAEDIEAIRAALEAWASASLIHWCDLELADAWFRRAMELTDQTAERRLDALPYFEQNARVREALDALMNGYKALDLPCLIDPGLRGVVERDTMGEANAEFCDTRRWARWATTGGDSGHGAFVVNGGTCVVVRARVIFRGDSTYDPRRTFASECLPDGTPTTDGGWERHYGLRAGRYTWESWAFADDVRDAPGQAGLAMAISHFLPPLKWYFLWVREIARSCVRRGPVRVVVESLRTALVLNAREVARLQERMTTAERRDSAGAYAALSRIANEDLAGAQDNVSRVDAFFTGAAGSTIRTGLSTVGGVVGSILGAVVWGIARLVFGWAPPAVARNTDTFGRDLPLYEKTYLTSNPEVAPTAEEPLRGAPRHDVPDPPGFVRTGDVSDGGELPELLTDAELAARWARLGLVRSAVLNEAVTGGGGRLWDRVSEGQARRNPVIGDTALRVAELARLRAIESWVARGTVTVVRGDLGNGAGDTWSVPRFSLPASRARGGTDGAAVKTGLGALALAGLAAFFGRARKT